MAVGQFNIPRKTFSFSTGQPLSAKLVFTAANNTPLRPPTSKRARPRADVDGEDSQYTQKKKRRLRLNLITSRLSRPFANPSSYIINRGNSRITRWTQQKASGRNLLRKAAIMNWARIRWAAAMKSKCNRLDLRRAIPIHARPFSTNLDNFDEENFRERLASPRKIYDHRQPRPPSPLGLSNYDAIDLEGDPYGDDDELDSFDVLGGVVVNSDFTKRQTESIGFDDGQFGLNDDTGWSESRIQSSKEILKRVTMEDSREEVSFAQFRS